VTRHPIIVLWSTPRSRSTAFERMMIERGDHTVFDEPFSARYYFSPERRSSRFDTDIPHSTAAAIVARLREAAAVRPVFVKDMAYHASGLLDDDLLGELVNTFLVREPRAALASFARKWPDLTEEEAGYERLGEAFAVARRLDGGAPPVLEADDLARGPSAQVRAWCDAVGIPFLAGALRWEPGMPAEWQLWPDWYEGVGRSSGFQPPKPGAAVVLDDRLEAIAARARPVYDELASIRVGR
jgi:hypothetical protein